MYMYICTCGGGCVAVGGGGGGGGVMIDIHDVCYQCLRYKDTSIYIYIYKASFYLGVHRCHWMLLHCPRMSLVS